MTILSFPQTPPQERRPIPVSPNALYRGLTINISTMAPISAVQFGGVSAYTELFKTAVGRNPKGQESVACAAAGGATSALVASPAELLVIQQQRAGEPPFPGLACFERSITEFSIANGTPPPPPPTYPPNPLWVHSRFIHDAPTWLINPSCCRCLSCFTGSTAMEAIRRVMGTHGISGAASTPSLQRHLHSSTAAASAAARGVQWRCMASHRGTAAQ